MAREMYIDHHIQSQILDELVRTDATFSELKADSVENSLFMYHMRKLIHRGIVEKYSGGYRLTREGASWCNRADNRYVVHEGPRNLVQFLVYVEGQVLVSRRKGAMTDKLDEYMLPGGLHRFGNTSRESAEECAEWFGLVAEEKLTTCETILPSEEVHAIVDVYRAHLGDEGALYEDELYESLLMPIEEVIALPSTNGALPTLVGKYYAGTLQPYEVVRE